MALKKLLTDPQNFRFYQGGQGHTSNDGTFGQKSIKYGNDRFDGANSGQPYITVGIPDNLTPGTTDFLQRGGINVVRDTAADVQRITKMFTDLKSPNGLLFTAKQQLLSRTAVRTQTSGLLNEGVYSPLNTLAQVGVVAFGGHLNKQGINPFAGTGAESPNPNLYFNIVKPNPNDPGGSTTTNRLVSLWDATSNNLTIGNYGGKGTTLNPGGNNSSILLSYTGGPGSTLGIGSTNIFLSQGSRTSLTLDPKFITTNSLAGNNVWVYSSKLLTTPYQSQTSPPVITEVESSNKQGSISSPKIQDFRKLLKRNLQGIEAKIAEDSGATPLAPDYVTGSFEIRTNIGDPGQRSGKSYADYSAGVKYGSVNIDKLGSFSTGLDKINSSPIYRSENVSDDPNLKDMIPFRIAIIDNNNPSYKIFLHFRAFLGSIGDSYNATWNNFQYLGRGENFYTYGGFTRQISLSWTVAAQSKQELVPMYQKLNYLASSLTPDYSPQGYMRGNLAELTVGGYIVDQPGIITSLTYDMGEDSPWEIGIDTNGNPDPNSPQMTQILKVSNFNFIPIQKFIPRLQQNTYAFNNNTTGSTNDDYGFAKTYGLERYISMKENTSYPT